MDQSGESASADRPTARTGTRPTVSGGHRTGGREAADGEAGGGLLGHVGARGRPERRVLAVAERAGRRLFRPGALGQPLGPLRPPRPVVLGRPREPLVRVVAGRRALPVVITALRGRVDERLAVPG